MGDIFSTFLIGWVDCKPRPVELPKRFVKPPFYYPCISIISISISPVHKRRETHGNTKENMGAVEMRRCRRSGDLLGDFRPGTSGGSIRCEVVCGLPVNPKQKKTK